MKGSPTLVLYAWPTSPYSAKLKSMLDHFGIAYELRSPNLLTWQTVVKRNAGLRMIPAVKMDGEWLLDSALIMDQLAVKHDISLRPTNPEVAVAAELLHLLADEWLITSALHFRWQGPEVNQRFVTQDFGQCLLPGAPDWLARKVGETIAKDMRAHLRRMGLEGVMPAAVADWTRELLQALDEALHDRAYVFGDMPCVADFALFGPIHAHLWRDPGSRPMVDSLPNLAAWRERLACGPEEGSAPNSFSGSIPAALKPAFTAQFRDQVPLLQELARRFTHWHSAHPSDRHPPGHFGAQPMSIGSAKGTRLARTFPLLRLQRVTDALMAVDSPKSLESWGIEASMLPRGLPRLTWCQARLQLAA